MLKELFYRVDLKAIEILILVPSGYCLNYCLLNCLNIQIVLFIFHKIMPQLKS